MKPKCFWSLLSIAVIFAMAFCTAHNVSAFQMGGAIQGTPINVESAVVSTIESANTNKGNNCAATVSSSLAVHIPIIIFSGASYWADLQYNSASSNLTIVNVGVVSDVSPYSSCTPSTLSSDFKLHISVLMLNSVSYWLDLEYNGSAFVITGVGPTGPSTRVLQVFKNSKTANGQNTGGDGTITSDPVGIICGDTCGAYFFAGDQIVLTAVPNAGSTFTGWSGACAGTGSCTVTMDADQSVTANFTKPVSGEGGLSTGNVGVKAKVQGTTGSGTVTSNPVGINCDGSAAGTCFYQFALGLPVILTATPKPGYVFSGWNPIYFYGTPLVKPDCPGTAPCTVLAYGVFYGSTVEAIFSSSTALTPAPPPYCNVSCSSDCFAPVSYQNNSCAECAAVYNGCVAAETACFAAGGSSKNFLYWNACH